MATAPSSQRDSGAGGPGGRRRLGECRNAGSGWLQSFRPGRRTLGRAHNGASTHVPGCLRPNRHHSARRRRCRWARWRRQAQRQTLRNRGPVSGKLQHVQQWHGTGGYQSRIDARLRARGASRGAQQAPNCGKPWPMPRCREARARSDRGQCLFSTHPAQLRRTSSRRRGSALHRLASWARSGNSPSRRTLAQPRRVQRQGLGWRNGCYGATGTGFVPVSCRGQNVRHSMRARRTLRHCPPPASVPVLCWWRACVPDALRKCCVCLHRATRGWAHGTQHPRRVRHAGRCAVARRRSCAATAAAQAPT